MNKSMYLLIIGLLFPAVTEACRPLKVLTLEETIMGSEKIIVALALQFEESHDSKSKVLFQQVLEIKGNSREDFFTFDGKQVDKVLPNYSLPPYSKRRFAPPGACYAEDYVLGNYYLLMLKDNSPYWSAFRPTNEEVSGINDPWVLWVQGFIAGVSAMENPPSLNK